MTSEHTSDAGFTLIELLIAMLVLSIGVVAVLGALRVGIVSGKVQREVSTAELTLRSFAEHVKKQDYVSCAGDGDYGGPESPEPEGTNATVVDVKHWDGVTGPTPLVFVQACDPEDEPGLQQVQVRVDSSAPGTRLETLILKRAE
jgi:prepilin-type N-terminal cleavage/methylation domain-containing protein